LGHKTLPTPDLLIFQPHFEKWHSVVKKEAPERGGQYLVTPEGVPLGGLCPGTAGGRLATTQPTAPTILGQKKGIAETLSPKMGTKKGKSIPNQ
jgi:hypothetical protein